MSNKIVLRSAPSNRRQPLLQQSHSYRKAGTRLGEAVGGTAAVCCCCPCVLANIMFLAIYKVPVSLCRRALKKKRSARRQLADRGGIFPPPRYRGSRCSCGCCDDVSVRVHPMCGTADDDVAYVKSRNLVEQEDKEVMELEKEMWDRFYSTGFWRSPSQRYSSSSSSQRITSTVSVPNLQVLTASTL